MLKRIIIHFYSYNYFNGPAKLFLDLYPIKFLNTLAKIDLSVILHLHTRKDFAERSKILADYKSKK